MSLETSKPTILFLDDDENILRLVGMIFGEQWEVYTTDSHEEFFEIIDNKDVCVAICDFSMPEKDGVTVLTELANINPHIRRILISGNLDLDIVMASVNQSNIHKVITKPWKHEEFTNMVNIEIEEYRRKMKEVHRFRKIEEELQSIKQKEITSRDEILDLMINISETKNYGNLTKQYVSAIEGMKSLAMLNTELFMENGDEIAYDNVFQHLSDIEVFANQYDQKILLMYLHILRAYLSLSHESFEKAMDFHKASVSLFHWLSKEYIDEDLVQVIKNFPFYEDDLYRIFQGQEFEFDQKTWDLVFSTIRFLLEFEVPKVVSISDSLFHHFDGMSSVNYLIALRNELAVYDLQVSKKEFNVSLISGFAVALTHFLEEVVDAKGDIDTIKHEQAVILFHKFKEIDYLLICSNDDLRYRIGLRQFAYESYPILSKVKENHYVEDDIKEELNGIATSIFRL